MNGADARTAVRLRRRHVARTLWLALLFAVLATGCAASGETAVEEAATATTARSATTAAPDADTERAVDSSADRAARSTERSGPDQASDTASSTPPEPAADEGKLPVDPTAAALVAADTELPPAPIGFESIAAPSTGPPPVSLAIEAIGVTDAQVIPVGVNDDLTFEVPPADQVGWYEFGPTPGAEGSAVLAAHIAFDGVDGVFRYLADVEVGSVVTVGFDDGTTERYRIMEVTEYLKDELPDELFAPTGDPQLALITCGGTFNRQLNSYESNIVAVAVPV